MTLFEEFQWRGVLYDATEGAAEALAREPVTAYIGFDPTASSLHVGSLLPIMCLARLQRAGHRPIALVGGGTGLIGDPSGKSQERTLLTAEEVEQNSHGLRAQLERFLDFDAPNAARMVNNLEWLSPISFLDFLRDVGKHFTVNAMLARESVKRRIGSEEGISFTEFSYQLLQAYDYQVLHERYGCTLQMGGSDQWGNILSGCDLIRKVRGGKAHGLVFPLVTTASGTKFGKTEAGTIWLDPARTSPFRFYQFWLNVDDRDVVPYLKYFTWLDRETVESLARAITEAPEAREASRTLAREVTRLVHGDAELARAERASAVLYGGSVAEATVADLRMVFEDVPSQTVTVEAARAGILSTELLVLAGLAASKSEAARLIKQGGVYLNDVRMADERGHVTIAQALEGQLFVLRKGRRQTHLVSVG
ncbi:MAG: tyrosine--tRNA ligase [Vicinamibacterales bacterium]|nr:tyrosine--tRNA ligase [Vicinamibacterales bacterium]